MNCHSTIGNGILEAAIETHIEAALIEDIGAGDLTALLLPENETVSAHVIVRENAVLCGIPWFKGVMNALDSRTEIEWSYREGDVMTAGSEVCRMTGSVRSLLTGERTARIFCKCSPQSQRRQGNTSNWSPERPHEFTIPERPCRDSG